jgi:uncharacterized membrane protein YhaH (DUF805 family)
MPNLPDPNVAQNTRPSPNPYAPPRAVVDDVEGTPQNFQVVHIFSYKGRMGRLRYLAYVAAVGCLLGFASGWLGRSSGQTMLTAALSLGMLSLTVPLVLWTIQRGHDLGWHAATAALSVVPFAWLVWMCLPGSRGPNRYGAPPQPNSNIVRLWAGLVCVVVALFLAAVIFVVFITAGHKGTW